MQFHFIGKHNFTFLGLGQTCPFCFRTFAAIFVIGISGLFSTANADDLDYRQAQLLATQLDEIEPTHGSTANLFVLAAALNNQQDVFKNDVMSMRDLLDRHWHTKKHSIALIAEESTKGEFAYPTRANMKIAARGLGQKLDKNKDVLLLFLTSHGSSAGLSTTVPGKSAFNLSAVDIRQLLEASGAKYHVVVLSACHSGALLNELANDNSLVLTAAAADRSSFGCSFTHAHTWFTEALMDALAARPNLSAGFREAAQRIAQREEGGEAYEHSNPQIHVGKAIVSKMAEVEQQAEIANGWQPPIYGTDEGKARRLLGDYLSISDGTNGSPIIRWLKLEKVGSPVNGLYPISAWSQHLYKSARNINIQFDPKTEALTGTGALLPDLKLHVDGKQLVGSIQADAITFKKVPRSEVFETRANHPRAAERAKANSVIRLLYIGAKDCPPCVAWERDHIEAGRLTKMPEYSSIQFLSSKRRTIKTKLQKDDLPESVQFVFDSIATDKDMSSMLSFAPSFLLMVDDKIRVWTNSAFLDSPIYPVLRAAAREKKAARQ